MQNSKDGLTKKPFRVFDLIIYALIAVAIVCLFAFARPKTGKSIEVLYKGERVLFYDFETKNFTAGGAVELIGENKFRIKTEKGYNDIEIDLEKKTATVTDADCKGKECVKMNLKEGAIICVPHSLVIKYTDDTAVKVG